MINSMRVLGVTLAALAVATPATESESARIEERLQVLGAGVVVKSVKASPVPGVKEVELEGGQFLYATDDGRYVIAGDLYELGDDTVVQITEERRGEARKELMADIPETDMIVFRPKDTRASVTVFTDTDCGYCRRLHTSMADYHAQGIEVRYLAYPRGGIGSETYQDMVSAWCAKDPQDAMTALKNGADIPEQSCVNPVAEQYEIGRQIGITGTPSILLADGRLLPGLVDAEQLADILALADTAPSDAAQ